MACGVSAHTQDIDVQLGQRPAELGHALAALGVGFGNAEDGVLVGVERDRTAVHFQVGAQCCEIGSCALARDEVELHQPPRGVVRVRTRACDVDEHQQRARITAVLEPAVLAAVDLHQFAELLAAQPRLVKAPALLARQPQAGLRHPGAQRLARHRQPVPLRQHLRGQGRAEVGVTLPDQGERVVAHAGCDPVVGRPAACLVRQRGTTASLEPPQQAMRVPRRHGQHRGRLRDRAAARHHFGQHLDALYVALAHHHPAHGPLSRSDRNRGRLTFLLCGQRTV